MTEKIGILVVSYGSRAAAILDAFRRSSYAIDFFVADKQRNPYHAKYAKAHKVIPDLDVEKIAKFAAEHKRKINFGICGPEAPIINGVRNRLEDVDIPMICPKAEVAIEKSKAWQRQLAEEVTPDASPKFKIFDPQKISNKEIKSEVYSWLDEIGDEIAVKPVGITAGKGVGVWGDHFNTRTDLFDFFMSNFEHGPVILEEKVIGEEFSLQFFADGKNIVATPSCRDYKRAFDDDKGPNTGGMGSYKDTGNILPFMNKSDWNEAISIGQRLFKKLSQDDNTALRGVAMYMAYICTPDGVKFLEINSRPGDPEIMNILPILKDDYVDVCFKILQGDLTSLNFEPLATVVTYKVPPTYGGKEKDPPVDPTVDLSGVYELEEYEDKLFVYPGSMQVDEAGTTQTLKSRTVAVVGVGESIEAARALSLKGISKISGANLWHRTDIASKTHINRSINHMKELKS
jgi:phosphoribosylamine--glycine ligase